MFLKLKQLEEEEPELQIVWNEQLREVHAKVMGAVQIEILKHVIAERFQVQVEFGKVLRKTPPALPSKIGGVLSFKN